MRKTGKVVAGGADNMPDSWEAALLEGGGWGGVWVRDGAQTSSRRQIAETGLCDQLWLWLAPVSPFRAVVCNRCQWLHSVAALTPRLEWRELGILVRHLAAHTASTSPQLETYHWGWRKNVNNPPSHHPHHHHHFEKVHLKPPMCNAVYCNVP